MANNNEHASLEGQLRTMILTNSQPSSSQMSPSANNQASFAPPGWSPSDSSLLAQTPYHRPQHISPAQSGPWSSETEQGSTSAFDAPIPPPPGLTSPKPNKRRPNQAQRRQMNSQLSIPIDPRPQQQQQQQQQHVDRASFGRPMNDLQQRPMTHGGHQHSTSYPHNAPDYRLPESPRSRGSWRGNSSRHMSNTSWNAHLPPHSRDNTGSRQGASMPPGVRHGHAHQGPHRPLFVPEEMALQSAALDRLCYSVVVNSEIDRSEIAEKEAFRQRIEAICRQAIMSHEISAGAPQDFPPMSVQLKCFGSLSSGFATKASDMDLGLLSPLSSVQPEATASPIPRLLEKALLDAGLGARLLSRTRVPIIKLCESPPEHLLHGLLEERQKWELSGDVDAQDQQDEDPQDGDGDATEQNHSGDQMNAAGTNSISEDHEFEIPGVEDGENRRFYLRQAPNQSISAYYALAKRVLRKAGGRDVTASNYVEFSDADWSTLHLVCRAFIRGLADGTLRQHLEQYPSLSFDAFAEKPIRRSLHGVFVQVEGEQILQAWYSWEGRKLVSALPHNMEQIADFWDTVQRKPNFAVDPISYTKELLLSLDKMKKIPWIQLVNLEQGQTESPSQYERRTRQILETMKLREQELPETLDRLLLEQYCSGILQKDVRNSLKAAVAGASGRIPLKALARKHKCLQLIRDLKQAVEKEIFSEVELNDIKKYTALLDSPFQKVSDDDRSLNFVISASAENLALASRIRAIQELHKMAPSQPKDRYRDALEFPKTGAGVQCDINFSAHLALQNTLLLRCYSHTDPRVRPMVLFIKHWAKIRGINSGYRGTLSSYGYVLMVLHYLVNICQPFVCPNLQQLAPQPSPNLSMAEIESTIQCKGYNIQFWRNEMEILELAQSNQLNRSKESIGSLLRGFFEYYAQNGFLSQAPGRGFDWGRDVLSLRSQGGLLTKQEKGWTGAKTVFEVQGSGPKGAKTTVDPGVDGTAKPVPKGDVKEVRHRYLFAIEDPFEHDHNVARTVTHNGIVSIRDEFRRAWRIIKATNMDGQSEDLLKDLNAVEEKLSPFLQLLNEIHGYEGVETV